MSQHEFEALVESSVRVLAVSGRPAQELRSLYWNLFAYEAQFDTGFTHFRTIDELIAARFVYRVPIEEHPDFGAQRAYFEGLKSFTFIEVPGRESDGGYFEPPHLYFDAGSALWRRLVEMGRLTGLDAEAPQQMDIFVVALEVVRLAERSGDRELIGMWYRLLAPQVFERDADELRASTALGELREIVKRTDALAIKHDYGMLRDPEPEDLEQMPELGWWFDLG